MRREGVVALFLFTLLSCKVPTEELARRSPATTAPVESAPASPSTPLATAPLPDVPPPVPGASPSPPAGGPAVVLLVPTTARPAFKTSLVDCVKHTEWTIPPEWQTVTVGTTDTAWNNERDAAIVRTKTSDRTGKELEATARRLAGPSVSIVFDSPVATMTGERTVTARTGQGKNARGERVLIIEASQSDDRGLNVGSPRDLDTVWVRMAGGLLRGETMARMRKVDDVVLATDACKCSYDCVSRRP